MRRKRTAKDDPDLYREVKVDRTVSASYQEGLVLLQQCIALGGREYRHSREVALGPVLLHLLHAQPAPINALETSMQYIL